MNIGLTLLAGAIILLSGSTLGLAFKVGAGGTDDAADPAGAENPGDAAAGTATARAYREAWNSRFISTVETIRSTIDACSQDGLLGGPAQSLGAELAQRRRGTDAA